MSAALQKENRALKAEIAKLQSRNARLEVESVSLRARVKALERLKEPTPRKPIDEDETVRRLAFLFNQGGYALVDGKAVKVADSQAEIRAKRERKKT